MSHRESINRVLFSPIAAFFVGPPPKWPPHHDDAGFTIAFEKVFKNGRQIPDKWFLELICLEIPAEASVWSESHQIGASMK